MPITTNLGIEIPEDKAEVIASEIEQRRCLYENADLLVEHQIITYSSGDREAPMLVHLLKDGLLWRTESGATPLPPKE